MAGLIPGMDSINWFPLVGKFVYWIGMILLAGLILGVFVVVIYLIAFNIKATVIPLYGSGEDGVFAFGKPKTNRVKWIEHRTAWKGLFPLFNKKSREPFDDEYIYPGNRIIIFELNNEWIPGRININKSEDEIRSEINPVPYVVRNWQSLQHKKNSVEFAKKGFWEENKYLFITLGVTAANLLLCGTVIYFTYKFATGGRADAQAITDAINSIGNIAGIAPR